MEPEILVLSLAVFGASALQSATGIGFGIIAGPVLLVVLNDSTAIQISIVLNLLIAVFLAPSLRQSADRRLLGSLLIGLIIGSPVGLLLYLSMDVAFLKGFAGFVVFFILIAMLRNGSRASPSSSNPATGKMEQIAVGVVAGTMGGSLAMPGPIPAAWMSARGFDKETIRATILVMFVFAYLFALALQFALAGIGAHTMKLCAVLAPSTVAGIMLGRFLSSRISEQTFRWVLVITLASTVVILFSTIG